MTSMLNQIFRSVMQPKIWRFICFVSSVVGLLCYALSSSFNHLFGKWNLLKIFLYIIFSFIICFAILFANTCRASNTNLGLKAHLVFSVFTITTIYSFFFDKAKGKPDLYSVVSCAAFAIMSLSLSKQTHLGFEVDLLYFFCGYLTLQLMKIKLVLVIIGVSFSYSLIIIRFYLGATTETGHLRIQYQDQNSVIIQVHADLEESSPSAENDHLIMPQGAIYSESAPVLIVDSLQENIDVGPIIEINLLSKPCSSDDNDLIKLDDYKRVLDKMNEKLNRVIWQQFSDNNYHSNIYYYSLTGMEDVIDDLHRSVKNMVNAGFQTECCKLYNIFRNKFLNKCLSRLEGGNWNIQSLINGYYTVLTVLLPNERKIWGRFFSGFSLECCIFSSSEWRRTEIELWAKLLVMDTYIGNHISGYKVHPFTREVMKCISNVSEDKDNAANFQIQEMIQLLQNNLDAKSKHSKKHVLHHLLMLNNNRYIQLMARYDPLKTLLGEDWIQMQNSKVNQNIRNYLTCSWGKVLSLMKKSQSMAPNDAVESMRLFNTDFSDLCTFQYSCFTMDVSLRRTLRRSLKKTLLPLYEKFIGRFRDVHGKDVVDMYIKYEVSDIEDRLNNLFRGHKNKKPSSTTPYKVQLLDPQPSSTVVHF